jgi:aryl-alcohol dehydrogenase-like predicted oxidoreductase
VFVAEPGRYGWLGSIRTTGETACLSRREFLGTSLGAGAALALSPEWLRAFQQSSGQLIQRAIPSSGEKLPVIGLSFSNHPGCAEHAALKEVLKTFADKGGRVFDAMHVNPANEQFHLTAASELGIQNKLFWSTRGTPGNVAPAADLVKPHIDSLLTRLKLSKIDLVMLPAREDVSWLAPLKEEKKAGRVRYIGVQVITDQLFPQVEAIMRNEPIDFIGVNYDIGSRKAEETILPLALERKIAVMAFFALGNASGLSCTGSTNLFSRAGTRPLPEWAAEFDAHTWAQFFLKYVVSHPAVTVARVGTRQVAHMIDDIGGGIGRLPNEATRKRMAELIDALPAAAPPKPPAPPPGIALPVAVIDRYVGEYKSAAGFTATIRRDGTTLFVKPGANPEVALLARSETRFQDPRGPFFEFQLDAQGKVTGAILEQQGPQGPQRIPLERK